MKKILFICFLLLVAAHYVHCQTSNFSFTSRPFASADLINYGRGVEHWYENSAWDDTYSGNAGGVMAPAGNTRGMNYYFRINWGQIATATKGVNTWTNFDNNFKTAIDNGQRISFGILPFTGGYAPYGSPGGNDLSYPTWVHDLMQAAAVNDRDYAESGSWVPNFNSPYWLEGLDSLHSAIANRILTQSYTPTSGPWNGISVPFSKVIDYVDVRGYGDYGEWHLSGWAQPPTGRMPTRAALDSIISNHGKHFPNYPLVIIWSAYTHDQYSSRVADGVGKFASEYQNNWGRIGVRRDDWGWGNGAMHDHRENDIYNDTFSYEGVDYDTVLRNRWKYAPFLGEPRNGSANSPNEYIAMPYQARLYHVVSWGNGNYASVQTAIANSLVTRDSIRLASKWMGYREELTGGSMTTTLTKNANFNFTLNWKNTGITPTYDKRWRVKIELRTAADANVQTWYSAFKPFLFLPSASDSVVSETLALGNVATGSTYKIVVSVVDSLDYMTPMKLYIDSPAQNGDGSYTLRSNITVQDAGVLPGKIRLRKL